MTSKTGYAWDRAYLGHETLAMHPEHPARVRHLEARDMCLELPGLTWIKPTLALGLAWVRRVHEEQYIEEARTAFSRGKYALDRSRETLIRADTYDVALASAAGGLTLVSEVASGKLKNGFAAVRPPGHHAGPARARGFCIFNNVAACAKFAQVEFGYKRVLIVDWDVHPADGTAAIFYDDPDVHVVSVHQQGLFPDTCGHPSHKGGDAGMGATWNSFVEKGTRGPAYRQNFEKLVRVAAAACNPDMILVSCGFDAHAADPLGGLKLDEDDFVALTGILMDLADEYCGGRLVSLLEGGYNPSVLKIATRAHVQRLMAA